jgi:hypothetical protein
MHGRRPTASLKKRGARNASTARGGPSLLPDAAGVAIVRRPIPIWWAARPSNPGAHAGELQSLTPRGQVHVFGHRSSLNTTPLSRKMDPTPDFAVPPGAHGGRFAQPRIGTAGQARRGTRVEIRRPRRHVHAARSPAQQLWTNEAMGVGCRTATPGRLAGQECPAYIAKPTVIPSPVPGQGGPPCRHDA